MRLPVKVLGRPVALPAWVLSAAIALTLLQLAAALLMAIQNNPSVTPAQFAQAQEHLARGGLGRELREALTQARDDEGV